MAASIESLTRNALIDKHLLADPTASSITTSSSVLHRSLNDKPLVVDYAQGSYIYLTDGRKILDATGGAAVSCLGHGNERIERAILQQMKSISYCHSLFFSANAVEQLANALIETTNGDMTRAFISSSGSEANEAALKFARQYHLEKIPAQPSRVKFISRRQSYHGTTLGALGVGGHAARRAIYEPLLSQNSSRISPCFAYRPPKAGMTESEMVSWLAAELDEEFQRLGPDTVAAFIVEPVVGAALGCVPSVPGYFKAMQRVCDRHGALVIMDEIMSGCGRIGPRGTERYPNPLHAYQDPLVDIVPDILTMGKGLGGGFQPVAAMLIRKEIVDTLHAGSGVFSHGQTYQGHPVACSAALEVQKIMKEERLVENVRVQGELLGQLLHERLDYHQFVGDIRGSGLFWGIEFVKDKHTKQPFDPSENVATQIHQLGLRSPHNISLYPGSGTVDGHSGDHILLAPAYNCTAGDVHTIVEITASVIENFFGNRRDAERSS